MSSVVRTVLAISLAVACLVPGAAHASPRALAADAAHAYDAKDYASASDAYDALTWGYASLDADVWYNAGNAHAGAGKRGQAIAAYRRALELDPRHASAQHNLGLLRGELAQNQAQDTSSFLSWLATPVRLLPAGTLGNVTALAWVAFWSCVALRAWNRTLVRFPMAISAVLVVLCMTGWAVLQLARSAEPRAIVVSKDAPLRTGPDHDYVTTHTLPDGMECQVLGSQAGWIQLQLTDGASGWLEADRVRVLPLTTPTPDTTRIARTGTP